MTKWLENLYEIEDMTTELKRMATLARALDEAYENASTSEMLGVIRPAIQIAQKNFSEFMEKYNESVDKFVKGKY